MLGQAEGLRREPKVITLVSGKGGVGKSVLAVNMAIVLSERGKKTLIFDADVGFGSVEILMGISSKRNLRDFFQKKVPLHDLVMKTTYGVDMISSGLDVEDLVYFNVGDRMELYRAFTGLLSRYDYIVVDFPPGYHENLENFYEVSDYLIIVTTDEPTSLINTYTFLKVMTIKGVDPKEIHVVMNMVRDMKEGRRKLEKLVAVMERFIGTPITATHVVKFENAVRKSVESQKPFVILKKTLQPSLAVYRITGLITKTEATERKISFFERIKAFLGIG